MLKEGYSKPPDASWSSGPGLVGVSIEGIIFDLDGVLLRSREAHAQSFQEVLGEFGITSFQYDRFAGWRTPEVFREMFAEQGLQVTEQTIAECALRKSQRARELVADGDSVMPDCVSVVQKLSSRYRLALASSGSRGSVEAFLQRTGLRTAFQSVLTGNDVAQAKPDPEIFQRSIEALGLPADACVVVEDAAAGISAARAAGARSIGMAADGGEALRAAGAEQIVSSLAELAGLFEQAEI